MKYTLFILAVFISINTNAKSNKFNSLDTLSSTFVLDKVDQLLFNSHAEQELKLSPKQIQQLSTQQRVTILGRFFRWVGGFFEPIWG